MADERKTARSAAEAGWHVSRYNISAKVPETGKTVIANLLTGSCTEYSPLELYLMSALDEISEDHPIIGLLARRGAICNFDELAAIEAEGHIGVAKTHTLGLIVCPTLGCNFDCPYCFENHYAGKMSAQVQDDVVALAGRLIDANTPQHMKVTWFGGEPLLAPEIIESLSQRLIALADERGVDYDAGIITNGYLLNQDIVDMLARCKICALQVTLDGIGAVHDATRHLAGGGPTFDHIARNLRECRFPFQVFVRYNIHEGNRAQVSAIEPFIEQLAKESGNDISCVSARVVSNKPAEDRQGQAQLLCGAEKAEVAIEVDSSRFGPGRAAFCNANNTVGATVDHEGNLYQCGTVVGEPRFSYGTAREWDPARPLATAANRDMLTCYLNAYGATCDPECRECVWLPHCAGGCPHMRLFGEGRQCVPYRNTPEAFVLATYAKQRQR